MYKNKAVRKRLVVGIIILFIGVGIHPAFAVETKTPIVNNLSEEDCGCQVVNSYDLFRVKLLMVRLKVITNILLLRFGYTPEIQEKCQEILDIINSNNFWYFPIFCSIFEKLFNATYTLYNNVGDMHDYLIEKFPNLKNIICMIFHPIFNQLGLTLGYMYWIGVAFCDWEDPLPNS